ncbi:DNA repair exonuclease [Emcibacter sp. SYSU 3D8]|uniref:metallophosphoesterase family protein n=1 Tax=Emcibacter sp. SYSU 3D8 TaxID=3133969 RepID=UPI0031FE5208
MVRFIHTADWQIGKHFANIPGDAGAALRSQRIDTVKAIAALARTEEVDAVLVAGDVFDANTVSDRTIRQLVNALSGFSGDWVFIPGNHDAALAVSAWSRLSGMGAPPNVKLALTPEPLMVADGRIALLPAVLQRRHEVGDLTEWFDGAVTPAGVPRIGLAHGSVPEWLPSQSEAPNPIAPDRPTRARLDYLGLGDWHGTLKINDHCWYAGTPEADRFTSSDPGNVLLVDVQGAGAPPVVERRRVGRYRWSQQDATLNDPADLEAVGRLLGSLEGDHADHLVWLRLEGLIDFAGRRHLDEMCADWEGRFHHLRLDQDGLTAVPNEDDIDLIDRSGFVREAIEHLRGIAASPGHEQASTARDALLRLYQEHVRLGN